jgi:hypothetical protein
MTLRFALAVLAMIAVHASLPAHAADDTGTRSQTVQTLTVGVTGKALVPLAASKDALIPGTKFHASAQTACTPPFESRPQKCEAFVIRRGIDGTATVEVRAPNAMLRRILFVAGVPVASDSAQAMAHSRDGDRTVVKFGTDERYDLPDALIRGG